MKTKCLTLALLLLSVATFAQTKLADELPALMQARNANAQTFFQERLTSDVVNLCNHEDERILLATTLWLLSVVGYAQSEVTHLNQ